jgi:short-subunit dehydrogenase involved in D-alanine esterification of teichoic acids
MNLKMRRVLITGGGSGIGLALARGLAGDNRVVVAGRDPARLAVAASGTPGLRTVRLDVTSEK